MDGAVRRNGERVRVRAELVDAGTGGVRWSRVYEQPLDDMFTLQEEVASAIAHELQLELTGGPGASQPNPGRDGAYELYLRGRYEWAQRTEAGMWKAIEAFRAAITADPEFARAYAGLADAYRLLPAYGNVSGPDALRLSMSAALRAVELDETLAESHAALAASYVEADHNRALATREYLRAIEINPNEVTALRWYGLHLAAEGDFDQAEKFVARARELDPLSHVAIGSVGTVQYFARRFHDAIQTFGEALTLSPDWATGHAVLGRVYLAAGRREEALAALRTAVELSGGEGNDRALLATAHAASGHEEQARALLREITNVSDGFVPAAGIAGAYCALGEREQALSWLERAIELSDTDVKYLRVDPRFDELRGDARFERILDRLGLS